MRKIIFLFFGLAISFILHAQQIISEDSLQQYTGKYIFPEGSVVTEIDILIENGVLKSNSSAGSATLTQLGVDSFLIVEYSGTAVFKRNEEKKVDAVHIEAAGYVLDGKKKETGLWIFINYYLPTNKEFFLKRE